MAYNDEHYIKNKKSRAELASLYKQIKNAGNSLPDRPLGFNDFTYSQLMKRISRTCPSCVKPAVMKSHIQDAKSKIEQYQTILQEWLADDSYQELPNDVHKLRPTDEEN